MKNNATYQEILLLTNTSFAARDLIPIDEARTKAFTARQKFEDACWNGIVPELLPEIAEKKYDPTLSLLAVNQGNSFLDLRYGKFEEEEGEEDASINPYVFLEELILN